MTLPQILNNMAILGKGTCRSRPRPTPWAVAGCRLRRVLHCVRDGGKEMGYGIRTFEGVRRVSSCWGVGGEGDAT